MKRPVCASLVENMPFLDFENLLERRHSPPLHEYMIIWAFGGWLRACSEDGRLYTHASEQLKDIPVWIANTAADLVIQKQEARAFMAALKEKRSPAAPRQELWLPYSKAVLHDAITRPSNPELPLIKASLGNFLDQILDAPGLSVSHVAQ